MKHKNKENRKPKKTIETNYTKALRQYMKQNKSFKKKKQDNDTFRNTMKKYFKEARYYKAATKIQKFFRGFRVRKHNILERFRERYMRRDLAAKIIQFYWRQYLEYWYEEEDIEPQELLQKPYSPDTKQNEIIQKKKERLGLVDYDYIPKISWRSRKLANKRRKNLGTSKLNVEDALLKENKIKNVLRERRQVENSLSQLWRKSSSKRITKKQLNDFCVRQSQHQDRVNYKVELRRKQTAKKVDKWVGKPTINKTSKNIKRSYEDLIEWKNAAEIKKQKKRERKEREETLSLHTFRSSLSSKHYALIFRIKE